jgi:hypothetical protein
MYSQENIIQILLEIVCALQVPERRVEVRPLCFEGFCETEFRDHDGGDGGEEDLGYVLEIPI